MLRSLVALSLLALLSGCASAPLPGALYTSIQAGQGATAQVGPKSGEACAMSILGLIALGDASITTARKNGGIQSVSVVDVKFTNILGLYATYCTVVYGK